MCRRARGESAPVCQAVFWELVASELPVVPGDGVDGCGDVRVGVLVREMEQA